MYNQQKSLSTMKTLEDLECGKRSDGDAGGCVSPPDGFDMDKFYRGRLFFRENLLSCCVGMFFSLIIGLTFPDFLKTLVFTRNSDTPKKAFRRYISTFKHIAAWHYGDIWETGSEAHQSILTVRQMHMKVRKDLKQAGEHNFLSQYHMGLVQSSFFVFPLVYSRQIGIACSDFSLDDYVYFWYGIGCALGIDPNYNICSDGRVQAVSFCKQIQDDIVIPSLDKPSEEFYQMSGALLEGWKGLIHGLMSVQFVISFFEELATKKPRNLRLVDSLRYVFWKILFCALRNIACFRKHANSGMEKAFDLHFREK